MKAIELLNINDHRADNMKDRQTNRPGVILATTELSEADTLIGIIKLVSEFY